jgi:hypothetical protein
MHNSRHNRGNQIGDAGADSLAGVLGQYAALAHLDLCYNGIDTVVKPLTFCYRHLALHPRCHLIRRQATRNSDILYTYSVVVFSLALSL